MKKLFLWAVIAFAASSCSVAAHADSPGAMNDNMSIIEGKWLPTKPNQIKLYGVRNGQLEKIASTTPDDDSNFSFSFTPTKEAFYVVGLSDKTPQRNFTFYIKPGDRLNVVIENEDYKLIGDNTPENKEVKRWHDWILPMELKTTYSDKGNSPFEEFFALFEEKIAEGFAAKPTGNQVFDDAFTHFRESYFLSLATNFMLAPKPKHPGPDDFPDSYKALSIRNVTTNQLLSYPYGMMLLNTYPMLYMLANGANFSAEEKEIFSSMVGITDFILSMVSDTELKGTFLLEKAKSIETYEGYLDFERRHSANFVTEEQREIFKQMLNKIPIPETSVATDFRLSDKDGNMVSLSDFKGKVVYIDVWATWCGPCLAQVPHLKKLEAEYHDNSDMVFMSISVDKSADHQKWLDLIEREGLGGVQLFGGDNADSELGPYKIMGIPRFMLIDKEGKAVNLNAPRPSSGEIRPLLDATLNK